MIGVLDHAPGMDLCRDVQTGQTSCTFRPASPFSSGRKIASRLTALRNPPWLPSDMTRIGPMAQVQLFLGCTVRHNCG